jgi:anti-anti-sigma factor
VPVPALRRPWPASPFAISLLYVGHRVDVRVAGSLDPAGSSTLLTAMEHLVVDHETTVTLDLADVDLVDSAGIRALGFLATRAQAAGSKLTVRSASAQVRDILHLESFDRLIDYAAGDQEPRTSMLADPAASAAAVATELLAAQLGPREHPFAVTDAALALVTTLAQATIAGADGVSVSLHRHGSLVTVAASDDRIAQMDRDQYATGQGPCLSAATSGQPVGVDALADETRWPAFVPRALMGGIASILSSPLQSATGPVGALNMYCREERGFGTRSRELAALFAEQASGILLESAERASADGGERLREALQTRTAIAQAQGIVMARTSATAEEAYSRLKLHARHTEQSVRGVSEETIASTAPGHDDPASDE